MEEKDEYFESYDNLEVHRLMLSDSPRTEAYRDAIVKNKDYFQGKVVMDVGAGSGILSLFSWKAGAKKVYAIEASPLAKTLQDIVKTNNAEEVIEVIHKKVEDVELTEKVDIIISEWMGFYLVHESMLDSVIFARDKFLTEDGIMMPSNAKIYAAPCSLKSLRQSTVGFWSNVYGFNMSPFAKEALKRTKPEIDIVQPDQILSDPVEMLDLNLKYTNSSELDSVVSKKFVSVKKNDKFQGLALWFKTDFDNFLEDDWNQVSLDTSPNALPTHWKQTVVPLFKENSDDEEPVEEDDIIGWEISLIRTAKTRQYALQVEILDPAETEHPEPCECQSAKCALIAALMKQEEESIEMNGV